MIKKNIFIPLNKEIRLNYSSNVEVAQKMGVTRQWVRKVMEKLETEQGLNLKTLEKLCNVLGYEIIVKKKKSK